MKKLIITLPYKLGPDEKVEPQVITGNFIRLAAQKKYPNGIADTNRRIFARIMNKLDDAEDKKAESIDFEDSEFDFIKQAFGEEVAFPTQLSQNITLLEDEIERVDKESKAQ
jgi:hypothetical protein